MASRSVEEAGAVGEVAVSRGEVDEVGGFEIEGAYGGDGGGNLLTVGSDILDRSTADGAGNSGEALKACAVVGDGALHKGVPVFSGSGPVEAGSIGLGVGFNATEGHVEDEAGKAGVGDKKIAAATQDEKGLVVFAGPADAFDDLFFRDCLRKPAGRATYAEGGQRGERDVLQNLHLSVVSH